MRGIGKLTMGDNGKQATPYEKYRGTRLWDETAKAIAALVENNDIVEATHRDYIVGYLCERLESELSKVVQV
jgi:hypothetical protein